MTKCFCFQTDFIIQFLATLVFNHDLFSQILFSSASWLGFCVLMKLWNLFPFIQRLFLSLFPQSRHTITLSTVIYHQSQRCYDVLYKDNLVLTQLVLRLYQFLWTLTIDWRSMTNKTQFKPIDEYLETLSENVQSILEKVRQIIQKRLPKPQRQLAMESHGNLLTTFSKHWRGSTSGYTCVTT